MSTTTLEPFDGRDVIASGVELANASGGLNKALAVDRIELHHGDRVVVAVEVEVTKVRFDGIKDTDALNRVHVMRVENATILTDPAVVNEALEAQRVRVEEAQGVTRLPYNDQADEAEDVDDPNDDAPDNVTDLPG